jgi:hypothetical protein
MILPSLDYSTSNTLTIWVSTYQGYVAKTLTEKYSGLSIQLDKTIGEANSEIETLQNKIQSKPSRRPGFVFSGLNPSLLGMTDEQSSLLQKIEVISRAYRDKSRKLLQTQELYDKVKRKAELSRHMQVAVSDAADSSLQNASEGQESHERRGFRRFYDTSLPERSYGDLNNTERHQSSQLNQINSRSSLGGSTWPGQLPRGELNELKNSSFCK